MTCKTELSSGSFASVCPTDISPRRPHAPPSPSSTPGDTQLTSSISPRYTVYVAEITYIVTLALTKASIVAMYLRIFWAYPPFQLACHVALAFILLPSAAILVATIFSCRPVAYFWDRDLGPGACLDVTALAYANSALAMAQDLVLAALPIGMLWRLRMSRRRKCYVAVMFAVGGLGIVATGARLRSLAVFGDLSDPSADYVPIVYFTVVELAAGVVCSCLPAVRILLARSFHVFGLTAPDDHSPHPSEQDVFRMQRPRCTNPQTTEQVAWKDEESMGGADMASMRALTRREDEDFISRVSTPRRTMSAGVETRHELEIA